MWQGLWSLTRFGLLKALSLLGLHPGVTLLVKLIATLSLLPCMYIGTAANHDSFHTKTQSRHGSSAPC